MSRFNFARLTALLLVLIPITVRADGGYEKEVRVSAPTRLDWVFAVANQSVVNPPVDWLRGYESTSQRYEFFEPETPRGAKTGRPLVLFISASDNPVGWANLEAVCKQKGLLFASPFEAGNNTPLPRRVRIVLDVLDDIRRKHVVDPDRTYLAGFSGGGRVACGIAFALPELFGGVMPVCAGGDLRDEPWLRHRLIDRLSVAFVTGTDDFNRGEVERFRGGMFRDIGVRTKVTVVPRLGHGIPDATVFSSVIDWLDAAEADRRKLADRHPASRIASGAAPSRDEWAKALLAEAQSRLKNRKSEHSGLMQLQGVMNRWPDLDAAAEAKKILLDYEQRPDRGWEADDVAEQRRFLIARARSLDAYASGDLPPQYAGQRPDMLAAAIKLWELVVEDGQDKSAVAEAKRRLPVLKTLAGDEP